MRPPPKQPPASLWDGLRSGEEQWVVFKKKHTPTLARYIRDVFNPNKALVTLYGETPQQAAIIKTYPIASITVPYDSSLTVAQRQELANALLDLYVMTHCASSE